jgi:putative serine protease PepD
VIVVLVAAGLVVATTNRPESHNGGTSPKMASLTDVPTTEPGVGLMPPAATIEAMVAAVGPSIVALVAAGPTGDRSGTAVVAESGGIVVTATSLVAGARSVTAVEGDGVRLAATPVGSDPTTGLSVLRIADDLPAALFDFNAPVSGSVAVAMALEPNGRAGAAPGVGLYAGSVVASGVALNLDRMTSDFATTAVAAPLSSGDIGCPLLDDQGHVNGLLERTGGTGIASASVFLPAELVWSVADQLVSSGAVDPGWIGVTAADADSATAPAKSVGAVVESVTSGSPAAAAGLEDGDVVSAVDSYRIRSDADLKTWLYSQPPGSDLTITFDRAGSPMSETLQVAEPPPDAPKGASSP